MDILDGVWEAEKQNLPLGVKWLENAAGSGHCLVAPSHTLSFFCLLVFSGGFHLTHYKLVTFSRGSENGPRLDVYLSDRQERATASPEVQTALSRPPVVEYWKGSDQAGALGVKAQSTKSDAFSTRLT